MDEIQESGFDKMQRGFRTQQAVTGSIPVPLTGVLLEQWNEWKQKYDAAVKSNNYRGVSDASYQLSAILARGESAAMP